MRYLKFLLVIILALPFLNSCKKDFSVNADWKDITIVYGLLSQDDSIHYLKITKAFLGPGNALTYARIGDSSNYKPGELSVRVDEYDETGHTLRQSFPFDTITLHTKEPGDSIFYFPDQLVYKSTGKLNENYIYKLVVHNNFTGIEITSQTSLIHSFSINEPDEYTRPVFLPDETSDAKWTSAVGGRRYQLVIRFHYSESPIDSNKYTQKAIDWLVFTNELSRTTKGGEDMMKTIAGNSFYAFLANNIKPVSPNIKRVAGRIDYIFSVASDDLNTYMQVTEPSSSVVQYRPPFSNITNGYGLFSSRFVNALDSLRLGDGMVEQIQTNPLTADLNFR